MTQTHHCTILMVRTCSATHVISLRVTVQCKLHNVTERKQQMSRVVSSKNCSAVTRKLIAKVPCCSVGSWTTTAVCTSRKWRRQRFGKNASSSRLLNFAHPSVDVDRGGSRVGRGAERGRRENRREGGRKEEGSPQWMNSYFANESCLSSVAYMKHLWV